MLIETLSQFAKISQGRVSWLTRSLLWEYLRIKESFFTGIVLVHLSILINN